MVVSRPASTNSPFIHQIPDVTIERTTHLEPLLTSNQSKPTDKVPKETSISPVHRSKQQKSRNFERMRRNTKLSLPTLPLSKQIEQRTTTTRKKTSHLDQLVTRNLKVSIFDHKKERFCDYLPHLSPFNYVTSTEYDERVSRIMDIISSASSKDALNRVGTSEYKAACWILFDDELRIPAENEHMPQRYAIAELLYATNQDPNIVLPLRTCDYSKVSCNDKGHITMINMNSDNVQGSIPPELSSLRFLEILDLDHNQLAGTIPADIGRARNLRKLSFQNNSLTGTIPSEIAHLQNLEELTLSNNFLIGTIPSEIGDMIQLKILGLELNDLDGTLPLELFNCTDLESLDLQVNHLTGPLPSKVSQLQALRSLWLGHNSLTGQIPSEIGHLPLLEVLFLSFNELSGTFVEEFGNITTLTQLRISDNSISGTLPDIFEDLTNLVWFVPANNKFTGSIPSSLWDIEYAFQLPMQGNDLWGDVPDGFCDKVDNFESDYSPWFVDTPRVNCSCCDETGCFLWDTSDITVAGTVRPECPKENVFSMSFHDDYSMEDNIANVTQYEFSGFGIESTVDLCLSSTGCYTYTDGETRFSLSYSQTTLRLKVQEECEAVEVCGLSIEQYDPKRMRLNQITQLAPNLSVLDDINSPHHKALCWILNQGLVFGNKDICDGTLLQRYVLAVFFFSQEHAFNFEEFADDFTCQWPGITCDSNNKFVEHINLPQHNISGEIITDIGLLSRLQTLDLSGNSIGSVDPSMFTYLPHLEVFNVSDNRIKGTLPKEILELTQLRHLDMSKNLLHGTLPENVLYSKHLETFNVGTNLMQGTIPDALVACEKLAKIDLSRNNFDGPMPTALGDIKPLREFRLQENKVTGSIPVRVFDLSNLEVFMVSSNKLTGTIPTEIGALHNIKVIAMNHNSLKGAIPTELEVLRNIEHIHVHSNRLSGVAPKIELATREGISYITDCGHPWYLLHSPLTCESCTMCCNSNDDCQNNMVLKMSVQAMVLIAISALTVGLPILFFLMSQIRVKLGRTYNGTVRHPSTIYNVDSIYCFIFSDRPLAWLLYAAMNMVQGSLFYVFLQKSNFDNENTDWQFSIRCPDNTVECQDSNSRSPSGWFLFGVVTTLFLGPDLITSIQQLFKGTIFGDQRFLFSGIFMFFLTTLAFVTSTIYNVAMATSDTDLIVNAVILLFVSDLDEQLLCLVSNIAPDWVDQCLKEISESMKTKTHLIVSKLPHGKVLDSEREEQVSNEAKNLESCESDTRPCLTRYESGMSILGFLN